MKKKITLQSVYALFLCMHLILLVIAGITIKENKLNPGEKAPYTELVPDSHEVLGDGTQRYVFAREPAEADEYLLFYTNHQEVCVYADRELIYERSKAHTPFGHTTGSIWNMVEFSPATRELVVDIRAVYRSGENNRHTFYRGSGISILRQMLHDSAFAMGISVLLVIIGISMVIYWLLLCSKTRVTQELLYMGISTMLIGIWAFLEEEPVMLLFDNRVYASYTAGVLLMLLGITFMLFLKHYIVREEQYLYKFLAAFAIGGMTLMVILQGLDIADFKETLVFVHIVLVCDLLYFLLGIVGKIRQGWRKRHVGLNIVGLTVLAAAVGLELYAYYAQLANMQIFGMLGLLAYIVILGIEVASDAAEKLAQLQKAEIYKELAEKDTLTKCYNRNAYTEYIQKGLPGESLYIVMLDLNDLKKCNDTLGHMEGDRYLTDSAALIRSVFDSYGRVYRIGGDEFCVIMENTSEQEIHSLIEKLTREEAAYNEQSRTVHMQIAFGYARYEAGRDTDLDKTRSRADMLMYENKKKMKQLKRSE